MGFKINKIAKKSLIKLESESSWLPCSCATSTVDVISEVILKNWKFCLLRMDIKYFVSRGK